MQIAFIALCLVGGWIFWRRRQVDPMLLGFAACVFYFAPAFPGGMDVHQRLFAYSSPIAPETYGVMIVVVGTTIATAWLVDRVPLRCDVALRVRHVPQVLLGLTLCAFVISTSTVGLACFCDKPVLLGGIDGWYYVAAYCAPL